MAITVHLPISDTERKVKIFTDRPVLFLAGPIRNAPDWQSDAVRMLVSEKIDLFIANPRRTIAADLRSYVESDNESYEVFERQRAWEQYYLYQAAARGCILFYLPKEVDQKTDPEKVYAHITMLELGEWIARRKQNPLINVVIATDGFFPEWSTIEYELRSEGIEDIYFSLKEGIDRAVTLIRSIQI